MDHGRVGKWVAVAAVCGAVLAGSAIDPQVRLSAAPAETPPTTGAEEKTVPGVKLARPGGGFLGLEVVNQQFRLGFYDEHGEPQPPDVARAAVRWSTVGKVGDERSVLNPEEGSRYLTAPRIVRPPYVFKVYLTLLDEEGQAVESHVADLRDRGGQVEAPPASGAGGPAGPSTPARPERAG